MTPVSTAQLTRYGLLALAGLSTEAAHASVVTSTSVGFVPFTISGGQAYGVSFGGSSSGGSSSITFVFAAPTYNASVAFILTRGTTGTSHQIIKVGGAGNNSVDPRRLGTNYVVSASRSFGSVSTGYIAGPYGEFNGTDNTTVEGFIGIRFQSSALDPGFHYGFFDIAYDNTPTSLNGALTIRGFAYETKTDAPITTFAISAAAPEPTSLVLAGLGLLACGGAGIRTLRTQTKSQISIPSLEA